MYIPDRLHPLAVIAKQSWRRLLIYKTLLTLNPSYVLRRTIWPHSSPRVTDDLPPSHHPRDSSHPAAHGDDNDLLYDLSPDNAGKMAPTPIPAPGLPRIVVYYQTHHHPDGRPVSVLPLIQTPDIRLTHLMLAALHVNRKEEEEEDPAHIITLNDHVPSHPSFTTLWAELRVLQAAGVKVLGMLGGAAKGTYGKDTLDSDDDATFERYYGAVRDVVRERALDGLDLDVEEPMSLGGVVRLIDRLREDFGKDFLITMAPVAPALLDSRRNLSGFDYEALEVMRGRDIAFYNCQFYCGWGDCSNPILYEMMLMKGWAPEKIVVGLVTNPANGSGFIPFDILASVLPLMVGQHARFGGVMGWEYFNSLPGGRERPWEWARWMTRILKAEQAMAPDVVMPVGRVEMPPAEKEKAEGKVVEADADEDGKEQEAPLPQEFEYHSDGIAEE